MISCVKQLCDVCGGTGNQPAAAHLVCLSCSGMRYVYVNPPPAWPVPPEEPLDEPPSRAV